MWIVRKEDIFIKDNKSRFITIFDDETGFYVKNALTSGDTFDLLPSSAIIGEGYTIEIKQ